MRLPLGDTETSREAAVERYLHLTRVSLPNIAKSRGADWPVMNDHCFQRIVLDAICGAVWYDHIKRPAYKHMSSEQAGKAVQLCEEIIAGRADLRQLNRQSLMFRGKPNAL
ncbi:MAG: hypothetical protein AAFO72_02240 [Pseudomonadota bacterium]